jgi:hypothetical protein
MRNAHDQMTAQNSTQRGATQPAGAKACLKDPSCWHTVELDDHHKEPPPSKADGTMGAMCGKEEDPEDPPEVEDGAAAEGGDGDGATGEGGGDGDTETSDD